MRRTDKSEARLMQEREQEAADRAALIVDASAGARSPLPGVADTRADVLAARVEAEFGGIDPRARVALEFLLEGEPDVQSAALTALEVAVVTKAIRNRLIAAAAAPAADVADVAPAPAAPQPEVVAAPSTRRDSPDVGAPAMFAATSERATGPRHRPNAAPTTR